MKTLGTKLPLIVALGVTSFMSAADRSSVSTLPALFHLLNLSPSFAGHPRDLTLLARPLNNAITASSGMLTFTANPRADAVGSKQLETAIRANIESLRFNARLEGGALEVRPPQTNLLKFTPSNGWNFKKSN